MAIVKTLKIFSSDNMWPIFKIYFIECVLVDPVPDSMLIGLNTWPLDSVAILLYMAFVKTLKTFSFKIMCSFLFALWQWRDTGPLWHLVPIAIIFSTLF